MATERIMGSIRKHWAKIVVARLTVREPFKMCDQPRENPFSDRIEMAANKFFCRFFKGYSLGSAACSWNVASLLMAEIKIVPWQFSDRADD